MRKLPYDVLKDFRPLSVVVTVPLILAVAADSPHKTTKDFVTWARTQGTSLNYRSTGIGGSSHLTSEYFNELAGTKIQHIPYAGGAPLVTAFAGGQPRSVPDDIAAKLGDAIVLAVARPEVRKLFIERNVEPRSSTSQEMETIIRGELDKWGPVIQKANIKGG